MVGSVNFDVSEIFWHFIITKVGFERILIAVIAFLSFILIDFVDIISAQVQLTFLQIVNLDVLDKSLRELSQVLQRIKTSFNTDIGDDVVKCIQGVCYKLVRLFDLIVFLAVLAHIVGDRPNVGQSGMDLYTPLGGLVMNRGQAIRLL